MKNSKITNGDPLLDEVEVNLNMLGSLMLNRVGGHVDGTDVVTIHQRSSAKRGVELMQQLPVGVELVLENPLPSDNIGSWRARHKIPSVILQHCIIFFHHSSSPIGIVQSTTVGLRDGGERCSMVEGRHSKAALGSRCHGMLVGD